MIRNGGKPLPPKKRVRTRTPRPWRPRLPWAVAALLALALIADESRAAETAGRATREYDLKAAFLLNFARFVEWPADAFPAQDTPITIGVLGEDPFGKSLDDMVAAEKVGNRKLMVQRFRAVKDLRSCHILFIGPSNSTDLERIRSRPGIKGILTVGETEDFEARSGIIRFVIVDNRVRLRINVKAAKAADLEISSKLLRQAQIVTLEAVR